MSNARRLRRETERKKLTIAKSVEVVYEECATQLADCLINIDWDLVDPNDEQDVFGKWNIMYRMEVEGVLSRKKYQNIDVLMRLFKKNLTGNEIISRFWLNLWEFTKRCPLVIPPEGFSNLPITLDEDLILNLGQ